MKKYKIVNNIFIKILFLVFCIFIVYRLVFDFKGITSGFLGAISFIMNLLTYFLWGFIIAFVLNQAMLFFQRIFKFIKNEKVRNFISICATYIITLGIIAMFIVAIVPVVITSIKELIDNIPSYVKNIQDLYGKLQTYLLDKFEIQLSDHMNFDSSKLIEQVTNFIVSGDGLVTRFTKFFSSTTSLLGNFIFGFIISIYMLSGKNRFIIAGQNIVNVIFPEKKKERFYEIARKANNIFSKFLFGKLIDSLIVGILSYITFFLIGVRYPLLLAFICGITNIIPYFGPIIGGVFSCSIILITNAEFGKFILAAVLTILIYQIDGWILEPRILRGQMGVNPLIIIAGVTIGGSIGGFMGMLLGVPVLALLKELFYDEYILEKIKEKKERDKAKEADPEDQLCTEVVIEKGDDDDLERD